MNHTAILNATKSLVTQMSSTDDDLIKVLALLEGIERLHADEQSVDVVACLIEKCKSLISKSVDNFNQASAPTSQAN